LGDRLAGRGPLSALLPQVADEQRQQLVGPARRHGSRVGDHARGRWFYPLRLEILEQAGHVVSRARARRQIEHVALDQSLFDRGAGAQHDAGDEPSDRMRR